MDLTGSLHFIQSSALALLLCAQIILLSMNQSLLCLEERLLSMIRLVFINLKIIINYPMTFNITQYLCSILIAFYSFLITRVVQLKSSPSSSWAVRITHPDERLWSDVGSRLSSTYPLPVRTCLRRNFSTKL